MARRIYQGLSNASPAQGRAHRREPMGILSTATTMGSTTPEIVTSQSYEVEQHLDRLRNIPFWIWDRTLHKKHVRAVGERDCCFNHAIGLPEKWDRFLPIFDWQKMLYDTLLEHKHIWIKKSTGLGATEFMLRYLAYAIVNNHFRPFSRICVVTGPRI